MNNMLSFVQNGGGAQPQNEFGDHEDYDSRPGSGVAASRSVSLPNETSSVYPDPHPPSFDDFLFREGCWRGMVTGGRRQRQHIITLLLLWRAITGLPVGAHVKNGMQLHPCIPQHRSIVPRSEKTIE